MTAFLVTPIIGLTLLAAVTVACRTTTGATAGTGEVSALAKDSHTNLGKGELMGTGVGAAAGALYDVKKRR
jgi:hypothetical protein